jgi:thioesterase domain-containing protein
MAAEDLDAFPPDGAAPSSGMLFWFGDEVPGGGLGPDQQVSLITLWPTIFLKPDIREIAGAFCEQIKGIQPAGPYLLGGPSFCALIALEVATRLIASGHEVPLLVMLKPWRPGLHTLRSRLARRVLLSIVHPSTIFDFVRNRAWKASRPLHTERRALYRSLVARSVANYEVRPYSGRVSIIVGDRMAERFLLRSDWRPIARGEYEVHVIRATNWEELIRSDATAVKIRECIARARRATERPAGNPARMGDGRASSGG